MIMKKVTLILALLTSSFFAYSQAEITVVAPPGASTTGLRAPNGTAAHTTMRGVIIVTAAELAAIPGGTTLSKLGFVLSAGATSGPASGNIQMYLENTADVTNLKSTTWATTISTMTSVYNGSYAIPSAAGNVDLTLTTPFVYTGGSVYVAYDYLGSTFATTGAIYFANSLLPGGWKGDVSATTTPPATITLTSAFRPNIRFTFDNPFTNELNVSGIAGEYGIFNNTIKTTQTVTSLISNTSQGDLTNIPVTLDVTGANPYSVTQTIPLIASGTTATLLFENVPTSSLGAQTLTVSIPADEVNTNNSRTFTQQVQCDTISYAQSPVQSGAVGFNTGAGLIANKFNIPNNIETYVKSVSNYFPITASNAGNTMKGILLDGNGVILDSTAVITITAGMLGTKQNFDFLNGAIDVSGGDIYVGFRQDANATTGYFPFANQNNSYVNPNAAATFNLFGGGTSPLGSSLGYMMIEATLTYGGFDVANSSFAGIVCNNTSLDITPTAGYQNYEFFVNGSSMQNGATPTYSTVPLTSTTTFNVNITNGTCALSSNLDTINISSPSGTDTRTECNPYIWIDGNTYNSSNNIATFNLTGASVLGCDSLVTLDLTIINSASGTDTRTECNSYTWIDGITYNSSNNIATFNLTGAAANGCDSLVTLNLTINNPTSGTDTRTECNSYTWIDGITYNSNNNSATFNLTGAAANGCDSLVTLNLTISNVTDLTTSNAGNTITANNVNATYRWLDCDNSFAVIVGETNASYTPSVNGNYAVELTENGCVDTSACTLISTVGIVVNSFGNGLIVYPNPTNGNFSIDLGAIYENSQILITDIAGKVIDSRILTQTQLLNLSIEEPAGIYIVSVQSGDKRAIVRLIKK